MSTLGQLMHWLTDGGRCPVGFCQASKALNWLQSQDAHICMSQHMEEGHLATLAGGDWPVNRDWGPLSQGLKGLLEILQVIGFYSGEKQNIPPPPIVLDCFNPQIQLNCRATSESSKITMISTALTEMLRILYLLSIPVGWKYSWEIIRLSATAPIHRN